MPHQLSFRPGSGLTLLFSPDMGKQTLMSIAGLEQEIVLGHFNRLIQELMRGSISRNTFQPWEVELILDIDACRVRESKRLETLRRYQTSVRRQIERGSPQIQKFSEYLAKQRRHKPRLGTLSSVALAANN